MKKLILSLGGLVGLLLVAAVAYVLTFDPNENKDWIAAKFRDATGHELTLGGDADLTLFPWLGLTLNDVTVSNGPDFSAAPLLHAQHAQLRVKLLGLLSDEYEIDTVRLHGLEVHLERLGNGRANWEELGGETPADAEPATGDGAGGGLDDFILGGVDIQDAMIVYDDQRAGSHFEVRNLDMSVAELVYGEPLDVTMSLDASSRAPELAAALTANGTVVYDVDNGAYELAPLALRATLRGPDVPAGSAELSLDTALTMDLDEDTLTLRELQLRALDTTLAANVLASRVRSETPAVVADLDVRGEDLAVLFRILDQDELARRIAAQGGSFSIAVNVDADLDAGTVNVPTLQAQMLGADINGTLAAARIASAEPAVSGKLTAAGPDLPTLVEVAGMLQGGRDSALSQAGRDLARVPDKSFRVQTTFDLEGGTLAVPELFASVFGATVNGNVDGERMDTDTPRLRGQLNAQGPDLPLLMMVAGQLQGGADSALNQYGQRLRGGVGERAFTLSTDFDADLAEGKVQLPTLSAALLGFRLDGNLDARGMQGSDGSVNGALRLEGDNLREVLAAIGQPGLAEVARSLTLDVQVGGDADALRISPLNLSLVLAGPELGTSPQTLALDADTVMDLGNDSLRVDAFTLNGLGLALNGSVSATRVRSPDREFEGLLELPTFDARRLLELLNQDPPATADPAVLRKVALSTAFKGGASSLALDDLRLTLDDTTITGSAALADAATQASRFTLDVDAIDADRYLAPDQPDGPSAPAAPADSALPLDTLRALTLDGSVNVGRLTLSGLHMDDIVVQVKAADGTVALAPIRASLYEGSFEGEVQLTARETDLDAAVDASLAAIELGPLLQDFMDATYLTGTGSVQLALRGSGADSAALARSLDGSGSLALENGVLQGVDVDEVLRRIETMIRSRQLQDMPQGGETQFENFSATLAVENGVVRSDDLLVEAPGWTVQGRGTLVNLNDDTIDYDLVASVAGTAATAAQAYDLGGYTLPIACTGSITSPRCLPDAQEIITAAVGNAVQQRLGEFLQDRLGTGTQDETAPADTAEPAQPADEETQPAEELLNRALDRLLR